ncbi:MAG TPA: hypothetical protein VFB13_05580 [Reyranella sp.]|nr:hypothetical protein [Reyranella sp.]
MDFKNTLLWKRGLGEQSGDNEAEAQARTKLREAYLQMRDNAAELVSSIPDDCKGLTVHDITHLDALWDVADTIVGPDYALTPSEAFVFGGALLLHDAGLTIAAYQNGVSDLARTTEWRDAASTAIRRRRDRPATQDEIDHPPEDVRKEVIFATLRALHARQAEQLATMAWPLPKKPGEQIRILDQTQLRSAYSHRTNTSRLLQVVAKRSRTRLGPISP